MSWEKQARLLLALGATAAALVLRQPGTLKKDLHTVQVLSNDKYVDREKYLRLLDAMAKPVLGQKGLVTGVDFASMVTFDYTKTMASRLFIVPSLEFDNMLTLSPQVNSTMRLYVESGHMLLVELGDPGGMNNPITFLNQVFGFSLEGATVSPDADLQREEIDGFAWPFEQAPETLPYVDNVYGVTRASLPNSTYKVYSQEDSIGVFLIPYGNGLVVGFGLDFGAADAAAKESWRKVLRIAIDEGRFLDKVRLGMSVIRHQGSTFGVIEANGNWSSDGRENLPDNGLGCKAWRRTLNCDPSGPRDFHGDKTCDQIVPEGESGFCECDGYVQTAAAPCTHRLINCQAECRKISVRYKDLYGNAYKEPGLQEMHDLVEQAYKNHTSRMMSKADEAVASVDAMVKAAKQAHDDVMNANAAKKATPLWKQLDEAGRKAQTAGKTVSDMADVANPFLAHSEWTYPKSHPNPPYPGYSRYMPANPNFQDWLEKNAYQLQTTRAPPKEGAGF